MAIEIPYTCPQLKRPTFGQWPSLHIAQYIWPSSNSYLEIWPALASLYLPSPPLDPPLFHFLLPPPPPPSHPSLPLPRLSPNYPSFALLFFPSYRSSLLPLVPFLDASPVPFPFCSPSIPSSPKPFLLALLQLPPSSFSPLIPLSPVLFYNLQMSICMAVSSSHTCHTPGFFISLLLFFSSLSWH